MLFRLASTLTFRSVHDLRTVLAQLRVRVEYLSSCAVALHGGRANAEPEVGVARTGGERALGARASLQAAWGAALRHAAPVK